jgi:hypothetical protein
VLLRPLDRDGPQIEALQRFGLAPGTGADRGLGVAAE